MKANHMQRIIVENPVDYTEFDYAVLGSFATTTRNTRYIVSGYEIPYSEGYETPSFIFSKLTKGVRYGKRNFNDRLFNPIFPLYSKPTYLPEAVYIDISSAYLQIANSLGAEFIYLGRGKKAYGETSFGNTFFKQFKLLRALIYSGTSGHGRKTVWDRGDLKTLEFSSQNYAPYLRFGIQAILHSTANLLKKYIYYWHTDGMILPVSRMNKVCSILDDIGFDYKIKQSGNVRIYGLGSYRFYNQPERRKHHVQNYEFNSNIWDENVIDTKAWLNIFSSGLTLPKTTLSDNI